MKTFHFDGPDWAFLTPEQMYDEEGKLRRAHKYYQNADIYFLTVMNKCLFNPKKTKVTADGNIQCEVWVGDPEKRTFRHLTVVFPLIDIVHALPGILNKFPDQNEFLTYALLNRYLPKNTLKRQLYHVVKRGLAKNILSTGFALKVLRAIYASEITIRHTTRFEINIFDPITDAITNEQKAAESKAHHPDFHALNNANWDTQQTAKIDYSKLPGANEKENCRLTIDQIVNRFDIEVGNQKIAYIGKTEQQPFDRLFPHVKLNELNSKLAKNEYETLVIHLFGFKMFDMPLTSWPATTLLSKSDAVTITEAELINYFKPSANEDYVKNDGKPNWKHIRLLLKNKYESIRGLLDIDGRYAKFYTSQVGELKLNRHEIDVDLNAYKPAPKKKRTKS